MSIFHGIENPTPQEWDFFILPVNRDKVLHIAIIKRK